MKKKVLIISGPTATGKTSLAIKITRRLKAELISADSRQIYQGLNIGTGKDHPPNTRTHLIDIITPDQTFSSAQFRHLATAKIKQIHRRNKLPIIVGGSGYYINSLLSPPTDNHSPSHPLFRKILNPLPLPFLQIIHLIFNHRQFTRLNNSERHNPHRLIRKLEVKLFSSSVAPSPPSSPGHDFLHVNLTAPTKFIYKNIDRRVKSRLDQGLLSEIRHLLKKYRWSHPGLNTLAYKEFRTYFNHPTPSRLNSAIQKWRYNEHSYARRQLTWFKKRPHLHFFDISSSSFPQDAITLILKWYNRS